MVLTKRLPDKTSKAVLTKRLPDKTSILTKRLLTVQANQEAAAVLASNVETARMKASN